MADQPPASKTDSAPAPPRPKIGLALGSGVARGWAHIGVLHELNALGVVPDVIAGTSIGAVVGGAQAAGELQRLEDWVRALSPLNFWRFLDFKLMGGGIFGGRRFEDQLELNFGGTDIESLPSRFVAVACDLKSGQEKWLNKGALAPAIRASFALPGIFEPVEIGGRWFVDGALCNPCPVSVCRAYGCDMVIAINLGEDIMGRARAEREGVMTTGEYGVFAEITSAPSMGGRLGASAVMRKLFSHAEGAPSIFANLLASLNVMQNRISRSRLAGDPPDVMITPRCGHIGLMEFHRGPELIDIGREAFQMAAPLLDDALMICGYRLNRS